MFQKVLEYAGEYRKTTYLSMAVMLIGIVMNMTIPFRCAPRHQRE